MRTLPLVRKLSLVYRTGKESGFALLTVLTVLLAASVLGGTMISTTTNQISLVGKRISDTQAFYRAEAMTRFAMANLEQNGFQPEEMAQVGSPAPTMIATIRNLLAPVAKAGVPDLRTWLADRPRQFLTFPGENEARIAVAAINPALGLYAIRAIGVAGSSTRIVTLGVRISGSSFFDKFLDKYAVVGGEGSDVKNLLGRTTFDARTVWSPNLEENGKKAKTGKGWGFGQVSGQIEVVNDDANTNHLELDAVRSLVTANATILPSWSADAWLIAEDQLSDGVLKHDGDMYTTGNLVLRQSPPTAALVGIAHAIERWDESADPSIMAELDSHSQVELSGDNLFVLGDLITYGDVTINVKGNVWVLGRIESFGRLTINARNTIICGESTNSIDKITDLVSLLAGNPLGGKERGSVFVGTGDLNTNIIAAGDLTFLGPHPRGITYTPETATMLSPVSPGYDGFEEFIGLLIGEYRVNLIGWMDIGNDPDNLRIHRDNLPDWLKQRRFAQKLLWQEGLKDEVVERLSSLTS